MFDSLDEARRQLFTGISVFPSLQLQAVRKRLRVGLDRAHLAAHAAEDEHFVALASPRAPDAQKQLAVGIPHVEILMARKRVCGHVRFVVLHRTP